MRIVIVEDEKPAARLLERKINKLGYEVLERLSSVEESVIWFQNNEAPELIFLDIQLSDGLSFEIFEKVEVKSSVVFTTAYDEYALRAFKLNSIDYILKPIQDLELSSAIQKFIDQRASFFDFSEQLQIFKSFMQGNKMEYKERFTIKIGNQIKIITLKEIVGFFSENKATYIRTKDNRDYLIDYSLEQLEDCIDLKYFFRISRKHIISLPEVKEILVYSNSRLKLVLQNMNSSEDWLVSRERVSDFKNWIE